MRAIKRVLPSGNDQIVLFIDQLEEVFTLVEDEGRRARFLDGIEAVVKDPHSRVRVVTTLRADFYDRPLLYPGFADLMRSFIEPLVPLAPDELERVIVEPARLVGVELEPGLMADMLAEVSNEPGALPLLQYALTELFQRREGSVLTLEAYRAIGGVSGALSSRADDLFGSLDHAAEEAAHQLFLRLITPGEGTEDARRRVSRDEIESIAVDQAAMATVLDRFGSSRLLSFDRDARSHEPTVEVAHEALLRAWPRLRGWIGAAREDVRMNRRLGAAATEWIDADRDPSFLLRGSQLGQFETWSGATALVLAANEREYLDASLEARRSRGSGGAGTGGSGARTRTPLDPPSARGGRGGHRRCARGGRSDGRGGGPTGEGPAPGAYRERATAGRGLGRQPRVRSRTEHAARAPFDRDDQGAGPPRPPGLRGSAPSCGRRVAARAVTIRAFIRRGELQPGRHASGDV